MPYAENYEKIRTYLLLADMGCPVMRSAVIALDETIDSALTCRLRQYFQSEQATVRYQYARPCSHPVKGGNRCELSPEALRLFQQKDALLWLMEPIDRLRNEYGINLYFHNRQCIAEIVGKGYDVSDLNRGQAVPQETILSELPVRLGLYCEWWKFLRFSFDFQSYHALQSDRLRKLREMKYSVGYEIFDDAYQPLPMEYLEKLLGYISAISDRMGYGDFCVSCTLIEGKFIFWDMQTPDGKKKIYGVG